MKKFLLSTMSILVFGLGTSFAQKTTLIENFTQASCGPCAGWNPRMDDIMHNNTDAILIRYQTSWPGFDPMHLQNEDDPNNRVDYYGVTGVPDVFFNGSDFNTANITSWAEWETAFRSGISNGAAEMSPLEMTVTHDFSFDKKTADIQIVIKNTSANDFAGAGTLLHTALVEKEILFLAPPGSNGETEFANVVRKMLPNSAGSNMSDIAAGDSVVIDMIDVDVPDYIYNYGTLGVVAFIQNNATREVLQASDSAPQPVESVDIGLLSAPMAPNNFCESGFTPGVTVSNGGLVDATEIVVEYTINGGTPVMQTWTGALGMGQTETINFPMINFDPVSSLVQYNVVSVNGATDIDYNSINNTTPIDDYISLTPSPTVSDAMQPFAIDALGQIPAGVGISPWGIGIGAVDNSVNSSVFWPLGGHGNSPSCMRFDFYGMQAGVAGIAMLDQVDLTNSSNTTLVFSHAYAQYTTEFDRLEVVVSTDCGATWASVWDKGGTNLATHPATGANSPRFYPEAADWVQNVVDLSFLDGGGVVSVGFRGTSAFGNSLYLDDVQVGSGLVNANDISALEGKVAFFPNPASDKLNIEVILEEASPITAEVFTLTGNRVATIQTNANYPSGTHNLNWNTASQANGMYLVKVMTNSGEITKRISVLK